MTIKTEFPYSVNEHENIWIPMSDGTRLAARMWLPDGSAQTPVPAIIEYLPYRKRDGTCARDALTHPYFAGHGYACLRIDIRGNGESEGLMEDEYTVQEQHDGLELIEWIAGQDWCDGNIGIMGISWGGFNGLQIAAHNPPALKAVITLCSTDDRYADDIHYKGGCLLNENLGWGATMLSYSSRPPDPDLVGHNVWRDAWIERLKEEPFLPALWLKHQTRDDYWKNGSICENFDAISAAVLTVGGWGDAYKNPVFRMLEHLSAPTKAIVGPWVHKYPHFAVPHPQIGFLQEALRWWDRWLKGIDTGVEKDPAYRGYVMDSIAPSTWYENRPGHWIAEQDWPSPNIRQNTLQLCDAGLMKDGTLSSPKSISSPLTVGTDCGEYCAIWLGPEWPGDQRSDDGKSLVFEGLPLDEPMDIVGAPEITLTLTSDQPKAQIAIRLNDVAPDGLVTRITYGVLNLCHRDSHEAPELLVPGAQYTVSVKLDHTAWRVAAGNRLRISISTSYWPLIWPSPQVTSLDIVEGSVSLPLRDNQGNSDEISFPPVETAPKWNIETLREPSNGRLVEIDRRTGETVLQINDDFGEVRDLDHGLINGGTAQEVWRILPEDPLSARGDICWTQTMARDEISILTEAECSMWSDQENFYLTAKVVAYLNGEVVNEKSWKETIPRNYL